MTFSPEDYKNAVMSCRFCPMCHDVDAVTTIARTETHSPRGRGLALFAIEKGLLQFDADVADAMYAFTADGLSREACAGHIRHDDMVIEARRRLVEAGAAPASAVAVLDNIRKTRNPWGAVEPDAAALAGKPAPGAKVFVVFGSTARARRPSVLEATAEICNRANVKVNYSTHEPDGGLLIYQLGFRGAALSAARALEILILESGARTVVTPDPDVFRSLTGGFDAYPGLPKNIEVLHISQFALKLIESGSLAFRGSSARVAWHDPCAFARFSVLHDAPRNLLHIIGGRSPFEFEWRGRRARCSGECGGLSITNPKTAAAIASNRLAEGARTGAAAIITTAAAADILDAASKLNNNDPAVLELAEFAAEHLS
ncbi:MAG: (Fe-S)-binding protein [Planctomycetes bacterium]|nr:(Fe-S)-binding protein [Planctomycetota bacterium]